MVLSCWEILPLASFTKNTPRVFYFIPSFCKSITLITSFQNEAFFRVSLLSNVAFPGLSSKGFRMSEEHTEEIHGTKHNII